MFYHSNMLFISRAMRYYHNIPTPVWCYAFRGIPESLNDVCDCKNHCKYKPERDGGLKVADFKFRRVLKN